MVGDVLAAELDGLGELAFEPRLCHEQNLVEMRDASAGERVGTDARHAPVAWARNAEAGATRREPERWDEHALTE